MPVNSRRGPRPAVANPGVWFVVLLVAVACYRLSLIGQGHFYEYDEGRQLLAGRLIDDVWQGEYRHATGRLFEAHGRPGFVLLGVIPTIFQRVLGPLFGVSPESLGAYDIAAAFNVLVSLGILCCLFVLGRRWTGSGWYALLLSFTHSSLTHSNIWIARLVPYDYSLLLFLLAMLSVSGDRQSPRASVLFASLGGVLSAFGYACYPGYYAFVVINVVVLFASVRGRLLPAAAFGSGFFSLILLLEALSRLAGTSYIINSYELSNTVRQGLFREGYVFLWRYLRDVDGLLGIYLSLLAGGFVGLVLCRRRTGVDRVARAAIVAAIACYLFHATMGVVFGKLVFYGRILGMYMPFVVGAAVLGLSRIRNLYFSRAAVCGLIVVSTISFSVFARNYSRIAYPADFLFDALAEHCAELPRTPETSIALVTGQVEELACPIVMVADAVPDGSRDGWLHVVSHRAARASGARFIGVNLVCVPYFYERETRFVAPDGYRLVATAPSPLGLAATTYEGRKPWERERLLARGHSLRIYERTGDSSASVGAEHANSHDVVTAVTGRGAPHAEAPPTSKPLTVLP